MTTTQTPTHYAAAAASADQITIDELATLLADDDNPDIFLGPRRPRRIAMNAEIFMTEYDFGVRGSVGFDYTKRNGYTDIGTVSIGFGTDRPVFLFNNGRVVQVANPDAV